MSQGLGQKGRHIFWIVVEAREEALMHPNFKEAQKLKIVAKYSLTSFRGMNVSELGEIFSEIH